MQRETPLSSTLSRVRPNYIHAVGTRGEDEAIVHIHTHIYFTMLLRKLIGY